MREFVDRYFKIKEFEATYRYGIHAMSTICLNEDIASPVCRPPNTRRPPGRPHKKRNPANEYMTRRTNICGRCHKQMRHNARTHRAIRLMPVVIHSLISFLLPFDVSLFVCRFVPLNFISFIVSKWLWALTVICSFLVC
ncbi:hypothetical protein V1524DRAFT_147141 [Lipomyces starkeyi]